MPVRAVRPPGEEDVVGFQIAVDESSGMGVDQRVADLQNVRCRRLADEGSPGADDCPKVEALKVLHEHIGGSVVQPTHLVDAADVFVVKLDRRAAIAQKTFHEGRVRGVPGLDQLQGHARPPGQITSGDEGPHRSPAQHPLDLVPARDDATRRQIGCPCQEEASAARGEDPWRRH